MRSDCAPFTKVLIANRGEIACRVIRTLDDMGIASVAVHHFSEARARHVRLAGEAYEIEGESPVAAHLDGDQIIRIALECGAQAIHPGYGFLSENAGFARKVAAAKLVFIGPDPDTIDLMGDKIRSRAFALDNGVPVAPSVLPMDDMDSFREKAAEIGFPLLIKASAGGGGKGMSIVRDKAGLSEAVRIASSEAERYFGDSRVYAELYIERPRHIEVQVVGDGSGRVVHMFERECSVQRRFQKIVEEAPAANLAQTTRDAICSAAVKLAARANYRNAGTVEFILSPDEKFYFLEMNTRLQVEHPVTEMITGVDLVAIQIEIAAGAGLSFEQTDIVQTGHAIECRLSAENAEQDFMPETGRVLAFDIYGGDGFRLEHGLTEGQQVTSDFDPMLAKLVSHAGTRDAAIDAMHESLKGAVVLGLTTNLDYLASILDHPAFRAGSLHTGFVVEHGPTLAQQLPTDAQRTAALLAAALQFREFRTLIHDVPDTHAIIGQWRN
jgi:propionyl-CoA carboxylase alpha chain/3-methylcrotonyl-CoA carboxylase alpha subunit/acetyl-CoA/propionyl-CoA carboxylase biotin carboxyl carrier protein